MAEIRNVALAGATGNLGPAILKGLLDAGFHVTVLTRQGGTSAASLPSHKRQLIKEVDYASVDSLTSALKGVDAVVSNLRSDLVDEQKNLIEAAIANGVRRFLPSEFGSDTLNVHNVKLPIFKGKVDVQKMLREKTAAHPDFSYTLVFSNPFWDWGVQHGLLINAKDHTATLYNGGNVPFSTSRLATVAKAVVGILQNLEATRNREIRFHDAVVTQQQMIDLIKEVDGKDWSTTSKDTESVVQESYEEMKLEKPNMRKAMVGFLMQAVWGKENDGDFSGNVDNELLGIKELNAKEVKQVMREIVQG